MIMKVKGWENSRESFIPLSEILEANTRRRHIEEIVDIVSNAIALPYTPLINSEVIAVNGLVMTPGIEYDYTISSNIITFNGGVLTATGHVLINYISL